MIRATDNCRPENTLALICNVDCMSWIAVQTYGQMPATSFPSLQRICLEVVAWSPDPYWALQKRRMQLLPEDVANSLMRLLLLFDRLSSPVQLDVFRDCLTELCLGPSIGLQLGAEWLAHIGGLRQLKSLSLQNMPRLRDKALLGLTGLTASLAHLDLQGCAGLTNRSLSVVGKLTSLQSLILTGTSMRPPLLLAAITCLTQLTRLHLGGCEVDEAEITQHITSFNRLQDLDLWGAEAGDTSVPFLAQLPHLQHLSLAWSKVAAQLPLFSALKSLDLSHCKLRGCSSDEAYFAAQGLKQLEVLLLVQTEADAAACELLETAVSASAPSLQVLDLTKSSVNLLPILLSFENATRLSALSLSGTGLLDDYCPTLVACSALQTLNLSMNPHITAAGLSSAVPAHLRRLDLQGTGVQNNVLPLLKQLPHLQQLVLADTSISWETKANLGTEADAPAGVALAPPAAAANAPTGPIVQSTCRDPRPQLVGWTQLQLLDLGGTEVTDSGCAAMAADMLAAMAACASNSNSSSGPFASADQQWSATPGLRVLVIGSNRAKLGRKGLTALAQLTSLQRLTLKAWQLSDRDLSYLAALQQLQQLHILATDPWLLSDESLLSLAEALPHLTHLVRDGRQLFTTSQQADAASPAASDAYANNNGLPGCSPSMAGCTRSMWPAGPLPDEHQDAETITLPWLQAGAAHAKARPQVHQQSTGSATRKAALSPSGGVKAVKTIGRGAGAIQGVGRASSSHERAERPLQRRLPDSAGSSSKNANVYQRLSANDERYRYSTQMLLSVRDGLQATGVAAASDNTSDATGDTGDTGQNVSQRSADAGHQPGQQQLIALIPTELRASSKW